VNAGESNAVFDEFSGQGESKFSRGDALADSNFQGGGGGWSSDHYGSAGGGGGALASAGGEAAPNRGDGEDHDGGASGLPYGTMLDEEGNPIVMPGCSDLDLVRGGGGGGGASPFAWSLLFLAFWRIFHFFTFGLLFVIRVCGCVWVCV
jgi:hypothetical protein